MVDSESNDNSVCLQETASLLSRIKAGDQGAYNSLLDRYYPYLLYLLHRKLNAPARRLKDTQDLVQEVLLNIHPVIEKFEYRGLGSFWAYLRGCALNHIKREWRRQANANPEVPLSNDSRYAPLAHDAEPLEALKNRETFEAYERALVVLTEKEREALLLRMDLKLPYLTIAEETGYSSPNAARMAILRASKKVYKEIQNGRS